MKLLSTLISRSVATLLLLLLSVAVRAQTTYDAVVAKDGSGTFTTVQAAINAAPIGRTAVYTIFIKNGKYREKVNVPSNKPFLQLIGQNVASTIISWDDYSGKPMPGGGTYGTNNSGTVTISAPDISVLNLTIENTTGDSPQALAISITADRVAFKNCRFLGGQDTILTSNGGTRQYFKDCYVDGVVDFIFGGATALFEGCVIYPKTRRDGGNGGYITAANTPQGQTYGYVFRKCYIPANRGLTTYTLGRPWQNSGTPNTNPAHNKVVWLNTIMGPNVIKPEGWSAWDAGTNTSVITYAEYKSRDISGNLVNISQRVPWSIQLADTDTATYTRAAVLGTWNPCTVFPGFCTSQAPEIAVTNFSAVKGTGNATSSNLTWNASWAIAGVQYQVLRSSTRNGAYTSLYTTTAANATDVNFATTDAVPVPGTSYFYYVRASKIGLTTHITDTLQISSTPTITTTGTLQAFLQGGGQPSATQSFLVAAENLTTGLVITPPANYQVSPNGGTNWASSSLTLNPSSTGSIPSTTISVRLNAATSGTYSGNITLTSTGATSASVAVTGTTQTAALPQSVNLQWWPMTRNNQDSTAVRSTRVVASTTTFRKFVVSDGSAAATIPPYSARYGQAFAPIATGSWLGSAGGNGSLLNRTFYEQFTVTGTAGSTVRVDSVLLNAFVTGSTSNTKLAVVWSRSNFVSDSADVTGGRGPAGALLSTANGGFTTPIFTGASSSTYRLALAGASGVTLAAGQRLTFRVYFSCGSTATATRFAILRDVIVKGEATIVANTRGARNSAVQVYPNPAAEQLTLAHPAATGGAQVMVYTLLGQQVRQVPCTPGQRETQVNLGGLSNGQYMLRYSSGNQQFTVPIIKQ